ncbi:MAG: transcription termination/antitermination protein NusA [Candidatus Colwellbacteria bacterium CG23_combo_of_CG06-09_8_20_14_all_42_19]|uniref:Transcription termination/antitermination protein NusA n=1 Tax=Candidatus Colwellbacteria bacterium CG23_combo_of_CG06-09_8_20_14_all_42_19 TaxID=1974541 RepID=A0A2H0AMC3_9BACT|nr:MAG: transcription termination/antitermination protein NusA [Candidatus Colwellbacteria bacterium CG23_combo_of_CG06-09_8_20_14_all_42_19]
MDLKALIQGVEQIAEDKKIEVKKVFEAIEGALAAAYKKEYMSRGAVVKSVLNPETGDLSFRQIREVVDETTVRMMDTEGDAIEHKEAELKEGETPLPRYNPERHLLLDEIKKTKKDAKVGDEIEITLETHTDFGRIAAQTAKQVIIQKIREAERDSIVSEFKNKEGQVASGIVQRFERGNVYIDLGRAVGVMFPNESIPGEYYKAGERLHFYILAVQTEGRTPGIILSRAHPKFVSKLFEMEVPEIADKAVEVKAITREPGSRTKIAVSSNVDGVDPVGSCVGQRGTRVMAVNSELGQEKLDIIEWSDDPEKFIANALSPAKARSVELLPRREARVLVADDQLSLAIGKGGQNVRLAAKLTGWKIDVRSQSKPEEAQEGGVASAEVEEASKKEDKAAAGSIEEKDKPIYHKVEDED